MRVDKARVGNINLKKNERRQITRSVDIKSFDLENLGRWPTVEKQDLRRSMVKSNLYKSHAENCYASFFCIGNVYVWNEVIVQSSLIGLF